MTPDFSELLAHGRRGVGVPRDDPGGLDTDRVSVAGAGTVAASALALDHPGGDLVWCTGRSIKSEIDGCGQ